jgi:hypothetical protein
VRSLALCSNAAAPLTASRRGTWLRALAKCNCWGRSERKKGTLHAAVWSTADPPYRPARRPGQAGTGATESIDRSIDRWIRRAAASTERQASMKETHPTTPACFHNSSLQCVASPSSSPCAVPSSPNVTFIHTENRYAASASTLHCGRWSLQNPSQEGHCRIACVVITVYR